MKKRVLSILMVLCLFVGLLPAAALAEDSLTNGNGGVDNSETTPTADTTKYGTVTACLDGGVVTTSDDGATTTVTYSTGTTLNWSPKNATIGRNSDNWWAGMNVTAPTGLTNWETTANNTTAPKYKNVTEWWKIQADSTDNLTYGEEKSFAQYEDDHENHVLGLWVPLQPWYYDSFGNGDPTTLFLAYYQFDWDGDGTYEQTVIMKLQNGISFSDANITNGCSVYKADGTIYGNFESLKTAISCVPAGGTVKLCSDQTLSETIDISKDLMLDLNGHNISATDCRALWQKEGTLTLTGKGTISANKAENSTSNWKDSSSVIRVGDGSTYTTEATSGKAAGIKVGEEVTISSSYCYGLSIFGGDTNETATISGTITAPSPIGTNGMDINTTPTVVLTDSAKITAEGTDAGYALYLPAAGSYTLAGTISGPGGVCVKAGNCNISSTANITATGTAAMLGEKLSKELEDGTKYEWTHNSNGSATENYAVVIENNKDYAGASKITISGGKITGEVAIYNDYGDSANNFALIDEAKCGTITITGGTFSTDPSEYVASGYVVSGSGPYTVSKYVAPVVIPATTTTTTTNEDGSTTTTTTNRLTGTVTETTTSSSTDEAGNAVETTVETVTNKDGSSTTTTTETVKAADGSTVETTTVVETDKDGESVSTETVKAADAAGTTATKTVETDADGASTTAVTAEISDEAAEQSAQSGDPAVLPVELSAATDSESAPTVSISVPESVSAESKIAVEIPVSNATSGTVAVLINADGSEEIVKTCVLGENGVVVALEGDATFKIVENSVEFEDVAPISHWAEEEINFVASRELFLGTAAGVFDPELPMTRAMLMTVLARLDGAETEGGETWYAKGMEWAVESGVSDGSNPEAPITREQLATMLYRYAGEPETEDAAIDFPDADAVSGYAERAVRWAVETGIIKGMDDGTLCPGGDATRAQVAAMIQRFCAVLVK